MGCFEKTKTLPDLLHGWVWRQLAEPKHFFLFVFLDEKAGRLADSEASVNCAFLRFQRLEARATIFNQLFSVGSPVPRLEMVDFISLFIVESEPIKCGLQDALTERSHTQFIRAHRVFYATWQAALCTAGQTFSNLILSASL